MSPRKSHFASTALRAGIPFGAFMGIFYGVQRGAVEGLVAGPVLGVFFGLAIATFASIQSRKFIAMRDDFAAEGLEHDGAANSGRHGGWLFLTPKRLVFVPHKVNLGATRLEIARDRIAGVDHVSRFGTLRLVVRTTADDTHAFLVNSRDGWVSALPTRA